MISTELYYDFRLICNEDYSEKIKFYEEKIKPLNSFNSLDNLLSRNEFIRRIFIFHNCAISYNRANIYNKAIELFNFIVEVIERNSQKFNLDLNKEHYYINSLFERGKAFYNQNKFKDAEEDFKKILNTGYGNYLHSNWYVYSRNRRLLDYLDYYIIVTALSLIFIPDFLFNFSTSTNLTLGIIGFVLYISTYFKPSKRLSSYFLKKTSERFNLSLEKRKDLIEYYSEKIKYNPTDYVSLIERAISYNFNDDFENSLNDLNLALSINSCNTEALYYRANAYSRLNNLDGAISDYSKLIELNEKDKAEFYNNRGLCYFEKNEIELALQDYEKAINLEPYYPTFIFNRAYLYQTIGKLNEAINDYNRVIDLEPENYIALTNRGEAFYELGNKEKAKEDFLKAKKMDYEEAIDNLKKFDLE